MIQMQISFDVNSSTLFNENLRGYELLSLNRSIKSAQKSPKFEINIQKSSALKAPPN